MIMEADALKLDNAHLTEELQRQVTHCQKIVTALELKQRRLYARNDALEALLRQHEITVPDWSATDPGGA